jgi:2-keto-3-deoxy-L-rhamnonate aldolase RhmA
MTEAVARCLAQLDGRFIGASDWAGATGERYRASAARVLATIANVKAGNGTGGLP